MAVRQRDIRQFAGDILEKLDAVGIHKQIDEFTAVRGEGFGFFHRYPLS